MITCRSCNTPNEPDAQFCISCGTPLTAEPVTPEGAVRCPSCNTANPPEAQFCVTCGAPLSTAPVYETAPTPPEAVPAPPPAPEPPAPSAAPAPAPAPAPSPAPAVAASATLKDRTTALILEILPALVGVFGIGWIYSGNTTAGVLLMVGMLVWDAVAVVGSIVTLGLGCFCFVPINLVAMAVSAYFLNEHTQRHPELFGAKSF